jgi:sulfur carrier protein
MKITVNGAAHDSEAQSLQALLEELGHGKARVATAVNGVFVPVTLRATQTLTQGDRVEVVAPRQGG